MGPSWSIYTSKGVLKFEKEICLSVFQQELKEGLHEDYRPEMLSSK